MEQEILRKINKMETQIDSIYKSIQTAKKILIWSVVLSVLLFVIPLVVLAIVLPSLIDTMTSIYSGF